MSVFFRIEVNVIRVTFMPCYDFTFGEDILNRTNASYAIEYRDCSTVATPQKVPRYLLIFLRARFFVSLDLNTSSNNLLTLFLVQALHLSTAIVRGTDRVCLATHHVKVKVSV